ncbi:MAG: hypothetical protein ACC652_03890 [Acidimicrobiales bacterium]
MATVSLAAVILSGPLGDFLFGHADIGTTEEPLLVSAVAGFTKVGFVDEYLVVVNVLPGEKMYSVEEVVAEQPAVGEMTLKSEGIEVSLGQGQKVTVDGRLG